MNLFHCVYSECLFGEKKGDKNSSDFYVLIKDLLVTQVHILSLTAQVTLVCHMDRVKILLIGY